jgi:hypothetical protein
MKIANIILALSLTVASIPAILPTRADAVVYKCFDSKGSILFVKEKLLNSNIKYLKAHPYLTQEQANYYKLYSSVKNRMPYCLNQSNDFAFFDRVINKNFDYVYTAKYSQVIYTRPNGPEIKFNNTKLIVTVKFQKPGPAVIEVTKYEQPPLINGN